VAKQGVDRDRFEQAYRSDAVTTQLAASRELTDLFEVQSTPSVIVDGRYLTSSGMTGGVAELLLVMEDLIEMVRAERRALK
jgi:thiol:disulfide interchange protein DsbA